MQLRIFGKFVPMLHKCLLQFNMSSVPSLRRAWSRGNFVYESASGFEIFRLAKPVTKIVCRSFKTFSGTRTFRQMNHLPVCRFQDSYYERRCSQCCRNLGLDLQEPTIRGLTRCLDLQSRPLLLMNWYSRVLGLLTYNISVQYGAAEVRLIQESCCPAEGVSVGFPKIGKPFIPSLVKYQH
jgi:hypothetical protein